MAAAGAEVARAVGAICGSTRPSSAVALKMLQTFRLLIAAGWLAVACASCTPKPSPAPTAPPAYKENPY